MTRNLLSVAVLGVLAVNAAASNINLSVQTSAGGSSINLQPNQMLDYRIVATLSDTNNEGLALVGLSLNYTGGDIGQQANDPSGAITPANPMPAFVIPDGITNPAGFGGTMIGGDLIQIGGAQNTINNDINNAPFPIGQVVTDVGNGGEVVVATGSFNVGATEGAFELQAFDVFANVIKAGETGTPFWATEAAGVGTVTNLSVTVSGVVEAVLASSVPPFTAVGVQTAPSQGSLWRTQRNTLRLTFSSAVAAPLAGELEIVQLQDGGAFGADISSNFTFTVEGGTVLRIRDNAGNLPHRTWFALRNTGGWANVAPFEIHFPVQQGDANGDGRTLFTDLSFINTQIPTSPAADNVRRDINGDASILFTDMSAANSRIPSDIIPKPTSH